MKPEPPPAAPERSPPVAVSVAAERRSRTATRRAFAAAAVASVALVVGAYANAFGNAFQFDDQYVLVENAYIRSLTNVPRFFADANTFASFPPNRTYRPLVSTSLALDYALGGGLVREVFHGSQLLQLLVLGALLVAFFTRVMDAVTPAPSNRWLALFAATLFCVHTVNTETLNLMHVRSELLSTIGLVAAFVVYGLGRPAPRRWLSLLGMAFGAFAKIPAIVFAPLVLFWEWGAPASATPVAPGGEGGVASPTPPRSRARLSIALRRAWPAFLAAALLYAFIEIVMRVPTQTYGGYDRYGYALTQAWGWVHYLRLFFLPVGLSADTDLALIRDWYDPRVLVGAAVIALLLVLTWRSARRAERWPVAFGLAWYVISLLPASSILPLAEPVNEHRAFVANIGLVLAVVWVARLGLESAFARSGARPALRIALPMTAAVLVLGAHAVGVHVRNRAWRSAESLWADVTAKSPRNGRAWMNYGVALMAKARWAEAKACFDRAKQLNPYYAHVEINLGIVTGETGDPAGADLHFRRALLLDPREPAAYFYYGRWLVKQGRTAEAIPLLERARQLSPADLLAPSLLLDLYWGRSEQASATRIARDLLAVDPTHARARAFLSGAPAQATATPSSQTPP